MKKRTTKRTNLGAAVPALRTHQVPDRTLTELRLRASDSETWEQHLSWAMSCTADFLCLSCTPPTNHQGVLSLCATSTHQRSPPLLFICCIIFPALLSIVLRSLGKIFWADDTSTSAVKFPFGLSGGMAVLNGSLWFSIGNWLQFCDCGCIRDVIIHTPTRRSVHVSSWAKESVCPHGYVEKCRGPNNCTQKECALFVHLHRHLVFFVFLSL